MSVEQINSSEELNKAAEGSDPVVIWVYDSDGANRGFGKKYEEVAKDISAAKFYKAGHEDIKDAIKQHGLDVDWVFLLKDGKNIANHREDHNAVAEMVNKHL